MSQAGEVVRAEVFEDYQGRSKGCGIVVYKNEESAQRAIKELTDTVGLRGLPGKKQRDISNAHWLIVLQPLAYIAGLHCQPFRPDLLMRIRSERPIFVREDREEGGGSGGKFSGGRGRGRGRGGFSGGRGGYQGGQGGGYQGNNQQGTSGSNYQGGSGGGSGGRQVFVSNLPWKTSWHDLKDLFRECGEVIRADVMELPGGRSKGVGTVLFEVSIQYRGNPAADKSQPVDDRLLLVRKACWRADVMELPGGRSKGVGTVLFASRESAQSAIDTFNNYLLDGRHISVRFDKKEM
ncbi:Gbp1p protein, putative [Eimeria praecox]|uniref:Gbp1p protein, putative n=1 Tax=Eimeria praecox TaxID=51316 RepID=U6G5I8_9EIME|nr:Gbp1p protein, putative [Eimeria praecox]